MFSCCFLGVGYGLLREFRSILIVVSSNSWCFLDSCQIWWRRCEVVFVLELSLRVERMGLFNHGFGLRLLELGYCPCQCCSTFTYDMCFRWRVAVEVFRCTGWLGWCCVNGRWCVKIAENYSVDIPWCVLIRRGIWFWYSENDVTEIRSLIVLVFDKMVCGVEKLVDTHRYDLLNVFAGVPFLVAFRWGDL